MSGLNFIFAPCGDDRRIDTCLEALLCQIGAKYGTIGAKDRIRGIKYIASRVPNGKVGHIKKMIRSYKKIVRHSDDDQFYFKIHKKNYARYAEIIMGLIREDDDLKEIVRCYYDAPKARDAVKETYSALNTVMTNGHNLNDKKTARTLIEDIGEADFVL